MNWKQIGRLLRTLFLLRVPLFTLVLLAAIAPVGLFVAKTLLANLFDERVLQINTQGTLSPSVEWTAWNLFIVSFTAFLAAFTAVTVINSSNGSKRSGDHNSAGGSRLLSRRSRNRSG